jgi:hypothetical protein
VADVCLGEFMRLYHHFAFREWLNRTPNTSEAEVTHLDEKGQWWRDYFGDRFHSSQRQYFAGVKGD